MFTYKAELESIDWPQLLHLYESVGLVAGYGKKKDYKKIQLAFQHSYKVITAWDNDKLIGAARMLSDEVCYGMIFDVGVLLEYQKMGVGRGLITQLRMDNEHLFIHLTSTFGNEEFYRKLGFRPHKTAFAIYPIESEYLI